MAKIKTRWEKRHVDNCGLYENDIFCETYRRIWEGLRQWDNETVILTVGVFHKNGNLGKWGIEQESTQDMVKTSNEVTKRGILTKDKVPQIWWVCQKFIKGLAKYSNEMTKRGMLIVGDFKDNDKFCDDGEFGKNLSKVWQKFTKRWQKGASWQMAIITNMAKQIGQQFI